MFSLLLKDFYVLKRQLLMALVYLALMSYTMTGVLGSLMVPGMTVAVTYILVFQSCIADDKSDSELILLSFPLLRREIVQFKYIIMFVYASAIFLCLLVVRRLIVPFSHASIPPLTWVAFAVTLLVVSLMGAVMYPLYFKFGYMKSRYAAMLFFFTIFSVPGFLVALLKNHGQSSFGKTLSGIFQWISSLSDFSIIAFVLLLTALFTIASYFLSLRIYKKREF